MGVEPTMGGGCLSLLDFNVTAKQSQVSTATWLSMKFSNLARNLWHWVAPWWVFFSRFFTSSFFLWCWWQLYSHCMNAGVLIRLRHELTFLQRYLSRSLLFNVFDYLLEHVTNTVLPHRCSQWLVNSTPICRFRLSVPIHLVSFATFVMLCFMQDIQQE